MCHVTTYYNANKYKQFVENVTVVALPNTGISLRNPKIVTRLQQGCNKDPIAVQLGTLTLSPDH